MCGMYTRSSLVAPASLLMWPSGSSPVSPALDLCSSRTLREALSPRSTFLVLSRSALLVGFKQRHLTDNWYRQCWHVNVIGGAKMACLVAKQCSLNGCCTACHVESGIIHSVFRCHSVLFAVCRDCIETPERRCELCIHLPSTLHY